MSKVLQFKRASLGLVAAMVLASAFGFGAIGGGATEAKAAGWDGPATYFLWTCERAETPPYQRVCTWYGW